MLSIQAVPKVIKIAVSQLQFSFGVGKGRTQYIIYRKEEEAYIQCIFSIYIYMHVY